jgi:hypothetical protein
MRWRRTLHDGSECIALVNLDDIPATLRLPSGGARATDLWTGDDLGPATPGHRVEVPAHGHQLIRIAPA